MTSGDQLSYSIRMVRELYFEGYYWSVAQKTRPSKVREMRKELPELTKMGMGMKISTFNL